MQVIAGYLVAICVGYLIVALVAKYQFNKLLPLPKAVANLADRIFGK